MNYYGYEVMPRTYEALPLTDPFKETEVWEIASTEDGEVAIRVYGKSEAQRLVEELTKRTTETMT